MHHQVIRSPAASKVSAFEPLLPRMDCLPPLLTLAHTLQERCWKLSGNAMPGLHAQLIPLLRAMNSYYTNKLEGQHTFPADIEDALRNQFSADPDRARKQRLARAHMRTEQWAEHTHSAQGWRHAFETNVVQALHANLYEQLPVEDRISDRDDPVLEGQLRDRNVVVGIHVAPTFESVPAFMHRWREAYTSLSNGEHALIGMACAHHRLAWIHPFRDGNGRIARLQSHLALHAMGLSNGLWSPMRGLARKQEEYYARLNNADEPRQGDYDGRGALSERGLIAFAEFFLEVCIDQVSFMEDMLKLKEFKDRLNALLTFEASKVGSGIRRETLTALHYIAINGPLDRGEFKTISGLKDRTAERALKALLDYGLLRSDTPKGKVYFGIPLLSLRFLFPNLWPEAEAAIDRNHHK